MVIRGQRRGEDLLTHLRHGIVEGTEQLVDPPSLSAVHEPREQPVLLGGTALLRPFGVEVLVASKSDLEEDDADVCFFASVVTAAVEKDYAKAFQHLYKLGASHSSCDITPGQTKSLPAASPPIGGPTCRCSSCYPAAAAVFLTKML